MDKILIGKGYLSATFRIIVLIIVVFIWACGPKQKIFVFKKKAGPGDQLFSEAEKTFRGESYAKALEMYDEYLSRFPGGHLADAALMKTGIIYETRGEYGKARDAFQRLIAEHTYSAYVADANVGILNTYYGQGEYKEVIERAPFTLEDMTSRPHIVRIYVLLGDTYMAIDLPMIALSFYIKADNRAGAGEKEKIAAKLKDSIRQMDSADIISVLEKLDKDEKITAYLLYQLGLNRADEEKYDDAIRILSDFAQKFPGNENAKQAERVIEDLKKKSVYSRYTMGCLLPLSGSYKTYGHRVLKGVELALHQFSSRGNQPSLKIIVKDTESDPVMAAAAVNDLFEEHVAAIIGPITTADSAAREAQDRGIPIITLTQKEDVADIGDYVFRNFITPKMQVNALVSYAFDVLGISRFAIFYPGEKYGTTFMNLFWDEVISRGGKVVGLESYDSAETDFSDDIKKLAGLYYEVPADLKDNRKLTAEAGLYAMKHFGFSDDFDSFLHGALKNPAEPDEALQEDFDRTEKPSAEDKIDAQKELNPIIDFEAVFIPDSPNMAGLVLPQLAFHDIDNVNLFGTNLWHSDKLIEMTQQYAQGAILPDGFFAESESATVKEFVRNYEETYNEKPGFIEAVAYDTAMILLQILSRPDIQYRSAVRNALMSGENFDGVTGLTSFMKNGDCRKKLYLLQVKGGNFVELSQPDRGNP